MTSEIRANIIKNRVGLGTIEYSNTGPVISGVTTALNFKTGTSNLHNTGLNVQDLDVDGHTNLDNVSIAGVTTFNDNTTFTGAASNAIWSKGNSSFELDDNSRLKIGNSADLSIYHNGSHSYIIDNGTGRLIIQSSQLCLQDTSGYNHIINNPGADVQLYYDFNNHSTPKLKTTATGVTIDGTAVAGGLDISGDIDVDGHTNLDNVNIVGVTTITGKGNIINDPSTDFGLSIRNNSTSAFSTSEHIEGTTNRKITPLMIRNAGATSNTETYLGFDAGNTSKAQWNIGIKKTGALQGDFIFNTRTGSSTSAERLRIDSAGRVGIGTDTMDSSGNLNITDTAAARIYMKSGDSSDCSIYFGSFNDAATGGIRYDHSDDSLRFMGYNNSEYVRILGGALLVNRTAKYASSSEKLSVNGMTSIQGSSTSTAPLYVFNTDTTGSGTVQPFIYLHDGSGIRGGLGLQYSTSNFVINANNVIQFRTGSSGVGGSERARITSGGQFVVGGTSSQASDAVTLMPDGEVTAAGFYFSNNIGSAMNACGIRRHTTNTMVFDTASTERVRIDADGNTSTKGSNLEHFVNKRVQAIAQNGNYVQYVLVCPTGTNDVRLQGKFHFTRATGTSGNAQQTVEAQLMTNNSGGDAQYYVRTASTDQGAYAGMYYRWVTCTYNSTTYYALEGHPTTGSSYWGGFMQHGVFTGTANACSNLGTVLNTGSHSITNITALTAHKAHERWYNTNLNVQAGALYVKQASGLNGGYFAPLYYDVNGAALPTQMKVHGQKAVCIDCTRYYTSGDIITFRINNDYEGAIYVNPSGVQYNTTSDYRLKENVINLTGAIDRVKQLKPKRFNFIKDPGNTMDGFMAHEVSSVVPNAVVGEKDAVKDILYEENDEVIPEGKKVGDVKEKDAIDPQSMDDSKLVPLLTAALQEAITEIETLKTKVAALEGS